MGTLDGRVAIITGAGRGLGREHALLFAAEGAKIVVNDLGGANDGSGSDMTPAQQTVADIKGMGGEAIVNTDNVADWDGAKRMIDSAIEAFGDLDILVNNAGILRDRVLVNMSESEWDSVIQVHLKGHFAPTHHAAAYWREQAKAGITKPRNLVHTSSTTFVVFAILPSLSRTNGIFSGCPAASNSFNTSTASSGAGQQEQHQHVIRR